MRKATTILIVDDDLDDIVLMKDAFKSISLVSTIQSIPDGDALLDYLEKCQEADDYNGQPGLILLDLNMPRKDGFETLKEVKSHPKFSLLPVIVFTTSRSHDDILRAYQLGANAYIVKPTSFQVLTSTLQTVVQYWLEVVELPC